MEPSSSYSAEPRLTLRKVWQIPSNLLSVASSETSYAGLQHHKSRSRCLSRQARPWVTFCMLWQILSRPLLSVTSSATLYIRFLNPYKNRHSRSLSHQRVMEPSSSYSAEPWLTPRKLWQIPSHLLLSVACSATSYTGWQHQKSRSRSLSHQAGPWVTFCMLWQILSRPLLSVTSSATSDFWILTRTGILEVYHTREWWNHPQAIPLSRDWRPVSFDWSQVIFFFL